MSCITNGSTGSGKTSHSSSVSVARKETLSSAAKRYRLVIKIENMYFLKKQLSKNLIFASA